MKLEDFLEKLDLFSDTPDAVSKMRELLTRLGVAGRLALNDPNERPVGLKISGTSDEESSLPSNWRSGLLGECLVFEYGDNLPATKRSQSGEYPVYGSNGIVGTHDTYLTKEPAIVVGRKGSAGALNIATGPSWTTDVAYFVRPPKDLDLRFTYYLLSTLRLDDLGKGIKPGLSRREAYELPITIPPLAEQKRIVAKVDELMALCDRLKAQQQERETRHAALARASLARFADAPTPANLDLLFHKSYSIPPADLRKSILTLAVQGKLVPQDPQDGDARELIDRAMKEREQTIRSKNLRRKQLDESAELFSPDELPSSWCIERFANLVDPENTISYGVLVPGNDVPDGVPFVRAQDLSLSNHPARPNKTIAPEIEKPYARTRLTGGEILLCVVGSIGKLGVAPESWAGANIARAVARIKPIPDVNRDYLLIVLQEAAVQTFFTSSTRTLAQPTLNVGLIEQTLIPVPPLAEQRRIVAKVNELMALVDALETQLATARTAGADLLEAAVHELLNPTAEIIPLPSSARESLPDRAAIGCYAIQRLAERRTFGRTAEVKVLYLAEAHLGLDLGGRYLREAAGPLDPWIYQFEQDAERLQWFSHVEGQTKDGHKKVEYRAGPKLSAKAQEASTRLSAAQRSEFDRLLELLAQKPTVEVEIIATLFAAWNDFLLDGRQPSDDEIMREVRENWHPSKQRFKEPELKTWLAWLRQHALVPQGRGPHTMGQQGRLQLH